MSYKLLAAFRAILELMRPANIVTAFADILAGFTIAGGTFLFLDGSVSVSYEGLPWLLLATFGLYGGGVVFNDVFDAELDSIERPERPIPAGKVSLTTAAIIGSLLLIIGVLSAFQVNVAAGVIAIAIAICAIYYDARAKHSVISGPLFMGVCRGGNLMLGIAILPVALTVWWPLALIPVAYIGAITLISQGEVEGGNKITGYLAFAIILLVLLTLLLLAIFPDYQFLPAVIFVSLLGFLLVPDFLKAAKNPEPNHIKIAVKRGVLSLIILNSALAAGFGGIIAGLIVFLLLPLSVLLAKLFAVT